MIANPWAALPQSSPYVLADDRPYVDAWNETRRGMDDKFHLYTELLPDPFVGPREAPVVLLARNPGLNGSEFEEHPRPYVRSAIRGNLSDEKAEHLLFYLTAAFADTAGGRWWRKCMAALAREGATFEQMARRVLVIEFHGYHSRKWTSLPVTLPSQWYGFELVEKAMQRQAIIILTRGADDWCVAVPALRSHERLYPTKNTQNSCVSDGNLPPGVFDKVREAIRE